MDTDNKIVMQRNCKYCNKVFLKKQSESLAYWATKRFCSQKCARVGRENKATFLGRSHSAETRERIKIALTGRKPSEETRKKLSVTNTKRYVDSPQEREKVSRRMMGNKWAAGTPAWNSGKPYLQIRGDNIRECQS